MSARPFLILRLSMASRGTRIVTKSKKLKMKAMPATRQKFFRTGTAVIAPMKKAIDSHNVAVRIDGPTSFRAYASLTSGLAKAGNTICSASIMINRLSSPIAKRMIGTTSAVSGVSF